MPSHQGTQWHAGLLDMCTQMSFVGPEASYALTPAEGLSQPHLLQNMATLPSCPKSMFGKLWKAAEVGPLSPTQAGTWP